MNQHNLGRNIPETVKRKVRKNSGFGCVICGSAICQYEHINPEYKDAKTHNPNGITLLCGSCHDKKTRKIYSREKIMEAMKNPKCKEKGFTRDFLDIADKKIIVQLGSCQFIDIVSLINIEGESIFSITPPNPKLFNEPYKLNAYISDDEENGIFGIKDNIWYGDIANWDIECTGTEIKIRKKLGDIVLHMETIPREKIVIHKLKMQFKGYKILIDKSTLSIKSPNYEDIIELENNVKITGKVPFILQEQYIYLYKLLIQGGLLCVKKGFADHCTIEHTKVGQFSSYSNCIFTGSIDLYPG